MESTLQRILLNFYLSIPITHSICILTCEIRQLFFSPWRMLESQYSPTLSCILKHQSAKIISPGKSLSKIPQCSVMHLSETRPPQAFETNEILACGVMATNTLTVFCCL